MAIKERRIKCAACGERETVIRGERGPLTAYCVSVGRSASVSKRVSVWLLCVPVGGNDCPATPDQGACPLNPVSAATATGQVTAAHHRHG